MGERWANALRADGWWVQKLPATAMSGLPDYLVGRESDGVRFVEAKRSRATGSVAFRRDQLSLAQRFFLDRITEAGGMASVVILDEVGWLEVAWSDVGKGISRRAFDAACRRW